jgi:hypothetical protein
MWGRGCCCGSGRLNRDRISRSENFWQMASCPRISLCHSDKGRDMFRYLSRTLCKCRRTLRRPQKGGPSASSARRCLRTDPWENQGAGLVRQHRKNPCKKLRRKATNQNGTHEIIVEL